MIAFLDTSSLIKLYHQEEDSEQITEILSNHDLEGIYLSELAKLEFRSALWKKVRVKELGTQSQWGSTRKQMTDNKEVRFQQDIIDHLTANGWELGSSSEYHREYALYSENVVGFVQDAYPETWRKMGQHYPQDTEKALLKSVTRQLVKDATLSVLRHGFKDREARIRLCQFKPDHGLNPETLTRYGQNRLRVVPELEYSPNHEGHSSGRLDLALFVNGIPTATLELKSEFKQSVENALKQYKKERPPKDPHSRKI